MDMAPYPGRSFMYGVFLWATSLGWWSFWGSVLIQSLLCIWLIHLTLRCHDLPSGPFATSGFCVGLGLLTGVSWYASELMPDILVPMVVLALWLLGFRWHRLKLSERAGLAVLTLVGIMSHMSGLGLAVGLVVVILIGRTVILKRNWSLSVNILPPAGVVAAVILLIPMLNMTLSGKATYESGGPVYLFARFVQAGIAQRWLANHCPLPNFKLCTMQKRIPKTSDDFLWARNSPFYDLGGWDGSTANSEMEYVVDKSLEDYPGAVVRSSLRATVHQFLMVRTGDGLDQYQGANRDLFSSLSPPVAGAYNAAGQQSGRITQRTLDDLNWVHVPVAFLSVLGLLMIIGWGLHAGRHDLAGLAIFIFISLLGNAFICGALSSPHNRYQSRLMWIVALVVGMAAVSLFSRKRPSRLPPYEIK
jgi:hypothetical protein